MKSKSAVAMALIVAAATVVVSIPVTAHAQSSLFTFTKVADYDTPLPGTAGLFGGTEAPPALDGERVAFWAYNDVGEGVYTATINGALLRVADYTTRIPGPAVPFEGFDDVSIDGARVNFLGWGYDDEDNYYEGIYRSENGAISRIADLNTQVPGRTGGFLEFYGPASSDNGQVAFVGEDFDDVEEGVYLGSGGPLSRLADTRTRVPGLAENFEFFYSVSAGNGKVAFIGTSASADGVYLHDIATGLQTGVADTSTQVPGGVENFKGFGDGFGGLDLDGGSVAFIGLFGEGRVGDSGVYSFDIATGAIVRIADSTTDIPGDGGIFEDAFTAVSINDTHVALGYGLEGNPRAGTPQTPYFGVYTDLGGSLESVLRAGDTLDGKVVRRAYIGADGLDGNQIAMSVVFADGTEGIYVATLIPEPANLVLLLTAVGLLAVCVARSRFRSKMRADRSCASHVHFWSQLECLEPRTMLTGAPDLTFSGDGQTTVDFGGNFDQVWSVAQQPDGKLVVAGVNLPAGATQTRVALARFNPDGSLDDGGPLDSNPLDRFGVGGTILVSIGTGSATARDLAIQADGKILVVGGAQGPAGGDFFVARLNADGSLDDGGPNDDTPGDAFGSTGGVVLLDFGFGVDDATAIAIQPDGRIVVGGLATIDTQLHWAFGLACYNTDGSPDNGTLADGTLGDQFGVGGKVVNRFGLTNAVLQDLVVDTRSGISQIVAVGYAGDNSNTRFAVARYDADGTLDPAFDGDGQVVTEFARGNNVFSSVAIQPDGRIVAAGQALMANGTQGLVARYDTDGKLDLSFGNVGQILGSGLQPIPVQPAPGVFARSAPSLVLQPNGKIIVGLHGFLLSPGGDPEAGDAEADFLLTRLNVDGGPDDGGLLDTTAGGSFGTGGVINTDFGVGVRSGDQIELLIIQSNGKLVAAGSANNNFAIARYVIETGLAGSVPIAQDDLVHTPPNTPRFVDVLANDLDLDLDVLVVDSVTQPAHGSAEITAGGTGIAYTPGADFVGTDQFDYVVSDGRGGTDIGTVTVAVNTPPVAIPDNFEMDHGHVGPLQASELRSLLQNDSDAEGDPLRVEIVAQPRHGIVTLGLNGTFVYTPTTPDERVLSDTFTYRIHDGFHYSRVVSANLHVPNRAPHATGGKIVAVHGAPTPLNGSFAFSDFDGDSVTVEIVGHASHGVPVPTVVNGQVEFAYETFFGRAIGPDRFSYRLFDGYEYGDVAVVEICVPNNPPMAFSDFFYEERDSIIATGQFLISGRVNNRDYGPHIFLTEPLPAQEFIVEINDFDWDGDPLLFRVVTPPIYGTMVSFQSDGAFIYRAPEALLFPQRDVRTEAILKDTADVDGDGDRQEDRPWIPSGYDWFVYEVDDGHSTSQAVVIFDFRASLSASNIAVEDEAYIVHAGRGINISAEHGLIATEQFSESSDMDGPYVVEGPAHGTLEYNSADGSFLYNADPGFVGTDHFRYLLQKPGSRVFPAQANLIVINDPPEPVGDHYWAVGDQVQSIPADHGLLANDLDFNGHDLRVDFIGQPAHGEILASGDDGSFVYRPDPGFRGTDTFLYQVGDGFSTVQATITMQVEDPVVAGDFATIVRPNGQLVILVSEPGTTLPNFQIAEHLLASAPEGREFPLGVFQFEVHGVQPGGTTTVRVFVPPGVPQLSEYWKYGPTANNSADHWYRFELPDVEFLAGEIRLHLCDGGVGDHDGEVNGIIVDPGGPAFIERPAPQIESIIINDGSAQRSKVNSITVTFDGVVTIDAGAFELRRQGSSVPIGLNLVLSEQGGRTVAVLTFTGRGIIGGSLLDGQYSLVIRGDRIRDALGHLLDGDGNGMAGGDRREDFFRRFGDSDGDGDVDRFDRVRFLSTFLYRTGDSRYVWYFDFENDGRVGLIDLLAFTIASYLS